MPARLADGLDQGSDLKTICIAFFAPSVPVERRFGSPAPVRRKAGRLRLQMCLRETYYDGGLNGAVRQIKKETKAVKKVLRLGPTS